MNNDKDDWWCPETSCCGSSRQFTNFMQTGSAEMKEKALYWLNKAFILLYYLNTFGNNGKSNDNDNNNNNNNNNENNNI